MADGKAAEVGTIGNEGVVGLPLLLGDDRAPTSVYVQLPGAGLRNKATLFKKELERSASTRAVMLRYDSRLLQPGCPLRDVQPISFAAAALLPMAADDARPHAI
jgi:hypothetical protein